MCDPLRSNTCLKYAAVQNLHLHRLSCLMLKPHHGQFFYHWQQVGPAPTQTALCGKNTWFSWECTSAHADTVPFFQSCKRLSETFQQEVEEGGSLCPVLASPVPVSHTSDGARHKVTDHPPAAASRAAAQARRSVFPHCRI